MSVFDAEVKKQKKAQEEAKKKLAEEDPYYKRALALTKAERDALVAKSNQEWSWPFKTVLTDDERQLLYRVRKIRYDEGEDFYEAVAVAAILGGLAEIAGGVVVPNGPSPEQAAEVLAEAKKNETSLFETLKTLVERAGKFIGKENTKKLIQTILTQVFGLTATTAGKIAKKIVDYFWAKKPTEKQKKEAEGAAAEILIEVGKGKIPKPPKTCPEGKLLNPKTNNCINDTPANRKKLGLAPKGSPQVSRGFAKAAEVKPAEAEPAEPAKSAPAQKAKKTNPWLQHVKEYYEQRKKEDPDYKWFDAMKDAKPSYEAKKAS